MADVSMGEGRDFPALNVVIIGPELAKEILLRNPSNRPIDNSLVAWMAGEILGGSWQVTHQGIALDGPLGSGKLIDGRHRLNAIVKADIEVPVLVFENVPQNTLSVLDTGKRRSGVTRLP